MSKKRAKAKAKVYSYLRFSSPEQKLGDSERRQLELAKAFAAEKKLQLDESLRDEGLSGYHGTHRKKGALGKFLKRVEAGEIPPASILVVENIDRLGREDVLTALETITTIINRDISIVTLSPYRAEYTRESINSGMIYQLVGDIKRAHAESETKSKRLRAVREQARIAAREEGRIMTAQVPAWIDKERVKLGEWAVIPEAVECLRRIFELKLQGVGNETIAIKLNEENGWQRPNGWRASYVKKIITNRAVLGEYQPHVKRNGRRIPEGEPIPDYYPQVIENEVFFAVQKLMQGNRGGGGRKDKCTNLLTEIVKCAYCGGTMQFVDKGKPPKGQQYLRCSNGYRSFGCQRYSIRYDECQKLILDNCQRIRPEQILPNPDAQAMRCHTLRRRVEGKEAELADIEQQIENLVDQIGTTKSKSVRARYESRIIILEGKQTEIAEALRKADADLADAEQDARSIRNWTRNLKDLVETIAKRDETELRLRLRMQLRELITKIDIFAVGYQTERDPEASREGGRLMRENGRLKYVPTSIPTEDDFYEAMEARVTEFKPELWDDRRYRDFIRHVADLRLTKRGRFLRVHFSTGAVVDLVPEGSLASGVEMIVDKRRRVGWRFVSPSVDRMWREYSPQRK